MSKTITFLLPNLFLFSCKKKCENINTEFNKTVSEGDTIRVEVGFAGDEGKAKVVVSPNHAKEFELSRYRDPAVELIYIPKNGFDGDDYIKLEITEEGWNCKEVIRVYINVLSE